MSLLPTFEIGVWNAWILTIWIILPIMVLFSITKTPESKVEYSSVSRKTERNACSIYHIIIFLIIIYSIFLPLKLGMSWFYVGLVIYLLGMTAYMIVMVNFATTPLQSEPITKGIYRYSRHPMYVTTLIVLIGVGIASASWLVLLLSALYMVFTAIAVPAEERFLLQQYGNSYREYMNRTSRWIGMPKS